MPSVGDSVYHSVWVCVDELSIILEAIAVWELFGLRRFSFVWMGLIMLVHDFMKLREYILLDSGKTLGNMQSMRYDLNLILTLLLCICVYYLSMSEDPKDPKPVDPPPVEPLTDPGAPPHKPHG